MNDQSDSVHEAIDAAAETAEDMSSAAARQIPDTRGLRLARIGGAHLLAWLAAMGLFAAADSWSTVTALPVAGFLCVIAGIIAGFVTATLIHEWFHFMGAVSAKGAYDIAAKPGLFVYDWKFEENSLSQFYRMSIAGSIGGVVAVLLVWYNLPTDSWGRAAFHGGALAAFVFGAVIEWPVLRRTRLSGEPFAELSKIDAGVLLKAFLTAAVVGAAWAAILR
ncbi:MAG: hypothetical protein HKN19_18540 [Halioglobus sp.]|nr:hypothetical protein [Halioglobus sp.]